MTGIVHRITLLTWPLATTISPASAAEEFKVGDVDGWRQPDVNYTQMYGLWTATKRFHVGDSLRFEYTNDSVLVVNKWAFYHCNITNASSVFTDGNTTINLDNAGPLYFISGDVEHCENGQRLAAEVLPLHPRIHKYPPPGVPPGVKDSPKPSPVSTSRADTDQVKVSLSSVLVATLISLFWHSAEA
ncbi:Phytocyanin domain-containing protein [Heracleum sosnowskyi]|uniref:Phytocyanin domain-containing protein n=1 Tax=Heracleum sosnowskyi TaxID=360622 RepID=A0AAD8MKI0_9APIA|nr:Phytocyanin domain-containing protein [Heracleum sosnowskyi]